MACQALGLTCSKPHLWNISAHRWTSLLSSISVWILCSNSDLWDTSDNDQIGPTLCWIWGGLWSANQIAHTYSHCTPSCRIQHRKTAAQPRGLAVPVCPVPLYLCVSCSIIWASVLGHHMNVCLGPSFKRFSCSIFMELFSLSWANGHHTKVWPGPSYQGFSWAIV